MRFKLGLNLGSGGGDVVFNPADLNPVAWYDFSDASLLFTDAGTTPVSSNDDAVYQVNDKAGSNNLTQTTLAKRPLYKTPSQNGLSTSFYDGVDDLLNGGDVLDLLTNNSAIFAVAKTSGGPGETVCGKAKSVAAAGRWALNVKGTNDIASFYQNDIADQTAGASYTATDFSVFSAITNRSAGINEIFVDGTSVDSTSFAPESVSYNTLNEFLVGAFGSATGTEAGAINFLDGNIAEIIIIHQAEVISLTDRQKIEEWLNNKWGVY